VAGYLLNHLGRPAQAVAELARVLKSGGRLAVTIWDVPEQNPVLGLLGSVCAEVGLTADIPAGPDPQRFADDAQIAELFAGWGDLTVDRPRWSVLVEPGAWFDAVAEATPRSGAALAQATAVERATARSLYVDAARERYGVDAEHVRLPAGAVLISGTPPISR
jgi:SAM-dependent methyltransferase